MHYRELLKDWTSGAELKGPVELTCYCGNTYRPDTYTLKKRLNANHYESFCSQACRSDYAPEFSWSDLVAAPTQPLPEWLTLTCEVCSKKFRRERYRVEIRLTDGHKQCFCGKPCASSYARLKECSVGIVPCGKERNVYLDTVEQSRADCCVQFQIPVDLDRELNHRVATYRYGATRRSYSYKLLRQQAYDLFLSSCYYCGAQPSPMNGIDRFDNSKGYEIENCRPCCSPCNSLKGTMDGPEFVALVRRIHLHQMVSQRPISSL